VGKKDRRNLFLLAELESLAGPHRGGNISMVWLDALSFFWDWGGS